MERLKPGGWYHLSGMRRQMWDKGHPLYGKPMKTDALYLAAFDGVLAAMRWHIFELPLPNREPGVLVMNEKDLAQLVVRPITRPERT